MSKNNKKLLIVVLVLILVLIVGTTYAWLRLTKSSNTVNKITAGNLELVLDDTTSEGIKLVNEVPRSYRQGMETKEYTFTLTNTSSTSNYSLSLKDLEKYTDEDGNETVIAAENRINDSKIRYILLKDGEVATADKSKILTDRTIDTGTIKKGQTISYSLRVWIDSHAGDNNTESEVMGKIFNVELSLVAEQTSQVTPTAKTICKRATTLHTEECNNGRCVSDGYGVNGSMGTATITYGNLGTEGTLTSGDAFDCDVNGDGVYDSATEKCDYVAVIDNTSLNIEVNNNSSLRVLERNIEYAYRLYSKKIKRGEREYDYTQVIQFNLNNFSFKGNDKIIDIYGVKNDSDLTLSNKIIFVQIYVPNLRKKWYNEGIESLNEAEKYILALVEMDIEKLKSLGGEKLMEEYVKEAEEVSFEGGVGESYDKEWALKDQAYRDGEEKGSTTKAIEIAKSMLEKNMDINLISELTKLSKEEIDRLK